MRRTYRSPRFSENAQPSARQDSDQVVGQAEGVIRLFNQLFDLWRESDKIPRADAQRDAYNPRLDAVRE